MPNISPDSRARALIVDVARPYAPEMPHHVMLVEDDDKIAAPLVRTLEREGHAVEHLDHGLPAVDRVLAGGIDLVLLDLGLPDVDGLEVCRRLRENGYDGGVMILTARGGEIDRVVGLDVGADDYLAKPFPLAELLARVRALLRRSSAPQTATSPRSTAPRPTTVPDGMRIDRQGRRVWIGPEELTMTSREFDVLAMLDAQREAVVTRDRLIADLWDENWYGSTKTLDSTIGRLRQKLEEGGAPVRIVTVRGVGFRLEAEPPDA